MISRSSFKIDNIQKKIVFYIVVITVPMFLISLYYIQLYVSSELTQSEYRQAQLINLNTVRKIENFLDKTSSFTVKAAYMISGDPQNYERTLPFLRKSILADSARFGSALALDPDGPLQNTYCKYFYRHKDTVREKWLMPPGYNYLTSAWFARVKETGKPLWSEPYFDKGGGEVFMSTYSCPVFDMDNRFLGVVTADVELNTLSERIRQLSKEKNEYIFLVSESGFLLSHPDKEFNLKKNITAFADRVGSAELKKAAADMVNGKSGVYSVTLSDGDYTLYTMYIEQTSWSVGIFMKNSVLFSQLKKLKTRLLFIMLADILLILIMVLIVSNQLKKNVAREEKIKNDIQIASRIQQQFLPKKEDITGEGYSLSGVMRPAKVVGGDFYGYKILEDKILFYVGDVSGKGIPSALFMMASQMLIEDAIDEKPDPAYILTKVNAKLSHISTTGMFATMIIGLVDLKTKELTFSIAGHPPFILNNNGAIYSPLTDFAPPIAVFEDLNYRNNSILLNENTVIVAFSDGVSEAENSKKEMFGTERIALALQNTEKSDCVEVKNKLLKEVQSFVAGYEQSDDLTIVVVRV